MLVGVPKEIKNHEYRVGLTPLSVAELTHAGHKVMVQKTAGKGAGFADSDYVNAGGQIIEEADEIFGQAEMIVKVKEPQPQECQMLRSGQILFTFLHLAPDPDQAEALLASDVVAVAYETVTDRTGKLPILTPMSEVAGRMSIQVAAHYLEKEQGGAGVLLGGVPGVMPGKVTILGAGVAGTNALQMAVGLGANVTVINRSLPHLRALDAFYQGTIQTRLATKSMIEMEVLESDVVIGAVLIPGGVTPNLVTRDMVSDMKPGSVAIDISIDQGGCFETSRPTSHSEPTYVVDDVIHYCVTNIPGAVPKTSTLALNNATLPFILELANSGEGAFKSNPHLLDGLNIYRGVITHAAVAQSLGKPCERPTFRSTGNVIT